MTFRTMNIYVYVIASTLVHIAPVVISMFASNLGVVFELIAAITKSSINFIWPGLFYLIA